MVTPNVMWFRRDLRLSDNPALAEAASGGAPVLGLFVVDDALWRPAGAARRTFLAGCLEALDASIAGRLVIRRGRPERVVPSVAREVGARAVYAAADFGPYGSERDRAVGDALAAAGVELSLVESPYAVPPGTIVSKTGGPYQVFTPFLRAWTDHGWPRPIATPRSVRWVQASSDGVEVPEVNATFPEPGEKAARRVARRFWDTHLDAYDRGRDRPDLDATSRLSPYIKWGCLHPRQLLAQLGASPAHRRFRAELCWREFYADVLHHDPDSARRAWSPGMRSLAVDSGPQADELFTAWAEGRTGYPIVDAGMRQLRAEGWMHNRVRMITASFLVKDLHIDWRRGARLFMQLLVDGDLSSNQHGWQWVAGTGTDASPFVRVFNPVTQSKRFDPDGAYIRRYVPELRSVSGAAVHEPWRLPLPPAGYPPPIVDHVTERLEALRRYSLR